MGMDSAKPWLEGEVGCRGGGGAEKGSRYQSFGQKSAQVMRGAPSHFLALPGSPSLFSSMQTMLTSFCLLITFRSVVPNPHVH